MEMPGFGGNQLGDTYYFTPLSVYNLGVVDCAHVLSGETDQKNHMHCHVYYEGVASKGSNNVELLFLKILTDASIICENDKGGDLNIAFENCSGQNKNNTVLRLIPFLVELGYFKSMNFVFLVVGHTKNSVHKFFNVLKNLQTQIVIPWKNGLKISVTPRESQCIRPKKKTSSIMMVLIRSFIASSQGKSNKITSFPLMKVLGNNKAGGEKIHHDHQRM